ncbi:MAG: DUF262 domain-containing protein, partial [Synergistaceae bacterium]|nr:DUF262 domain-containing protein [Synergistaceae bacterium]
SIRLIGDLINNNKTLFRIPVYQRNYDWSEEHCKRLFDDIERIITGKTAKHFLGSMVYIASNNIEGLLHNYVIIDGQQRLTTIMLLLKALCERSKALNDEHTFNDINDILYNRNTDIFRIKLKAAISDDKNFAALLEDRPEDIDRSSKIFINYEACSGQVKKWTDSEITPAKILNALHKLEVVSISLSEDQDDPQIIFESINSTGLDLSNADLIRNFLLLNEPEQERLFNEYWRPIEKNLKEGNDYTNLNNFFAHYMVFRTNSPAENNKYLYRNFTDFFKQQNYTKEEILRELKPLSEIYMSFVRPSKKYNHEVTKCLVGLRALKQTTFYPFMLHVFDDYEHGVIDSETLSKVMKFIMSYILRRVVCRVTSNSLRGFAAALYSRVFKVAANKSKYYEAVNKFISTLQTKDGLPSYDDFRNALINEDLYSQKALCRFILNEIENGDSKEILSSDNLTIEHIMPQNLSLEWKRIIPDEDHQRWLHTLGNLTLSGTNPELSNRSFREKQEILRESKAVKLNSDVIKQEAWTATEIQARARRLAKIITDRFKTEKINDPELVFESLTKITLDDDFDKVMNSNIEAFVFDDEDYRQRYFALMLFDVVKLLDEIKPDVLEKLAQENYSFRPAGDRVFITYEPTEERLTTPREIRDGIFIDIGSMSAKDILKFISALFEKFEVSKSRFYILIKNHK